jgi:hypothetical protein
MSTATGTGRPLSLWRIALGLLILGLLLHFLIIPWVRTLNIGGWQQPGTQIEPIVIETPDVEPVETLETVQGNLTAGADAGGAFGLEQLQGTPVPEETVEASQAVTPTPTPTLDPSVQAAIDASVRAAGADINARIEARAPRDVASFPRENGWNSFPHEGNAGKISVVVGVQIVDELYDRSAGDPVNGCGFVILNNTDTFRVYVYDAGRYTYPAGWDINEVVAEVVQEQALDVYGSCPNDAARVQIWYGNGLVLNLTGEVLKTAARRTTSFIPQPITTSDRPRVSAGEMPNHRAPFNLGDKVLGYGVFRQDGTAACTGSGPFFFEAQFSGYITDGVVNPWTAEVPPTTQQCDGNVAPAS